MKWSEENINELTSLVNSGKRIDEIVIIMGKSKSSIRNKMSRLGLSIIFKETVICKECGIEFIKYINQSQMFCGSSCSAKYNNRFKIISDNTKNKISVSIKKWHKENPKIKKLTTKKINIKKCKFCGKDILIKYRLICEDCKEKYYKFYRPDCEFSFNLKLFKDEFELSLVNKYGWYSPKNKGNNLNGVSKDHMYSVKDGFINNIPPEIIRHPANCKLMIHNDNNKKNSNSSITINELYDRIKEWDEKYVEFIGIY